MEIKPQELRIGNLVYAPALKGIRVIDPLDIRDLHEGRLYQPFQGIELTPEWLEKLGFKWRNEHRGEGSILDLKVSEDPREWKKNISVAIEFEKNGGGIAVLTVSRNYHYVHQLQNLYFALTGNELAIDNKSL